MKKKSFLVLMIVLVLSFSFSIVQAQHMRRTLKAERMPSGALVPVSPPKAQYPVGWCQLALDDGTPVYYTTEWVAGDRNAIFFDPANCGGENIYPFKLDTVMAMFYDFAGTGSVNIRVSVHRWWQVPCESPGKQLYLSPPITITTFYPNWVKIPIPQVVCMDEPFFLDIHYVSGNPGSIPSLLMDNAPADTCPLSAYLYTTLSGYWLNFNTLFWPPPLRVCLKTAGFFEKIPHLDPVVSQR